MVFGSWLFLILPIIVLYSLQSKLTKLVVVVVFLVVFSIMLAALTKAKDWEILAATAAFVAHTPWILWMTGLTVS